MHHRLAEPIAVEKLRPEVSDFVCKIVCKLMAKQPEERFQTPLELVEALKPPANPQPVTIPTALRGVSSSGNEFEGLGAADAKRVGQFASKPNTWAHAAALSSAAAAIVLALTLLMFFIFFNWLGVNRQSKEARSNPRYRVKKPVKKPVDAMKRWRNWVAKLRAERQIKEVVKKLQELNPKFDGKVSHDIQFNTVTKLEFRVFEVTDIAAVAVLKGLSHLTCSGEEIPGKPMRRGRLKKCRWNRFN